MCVCLCQYLMFTLMQTVSSEVLRQYGLSLLRSHIVLLTRTRACPLEPLARSPPVPRWKLFRMPKTAVIMDEPQGAHGRIWWGKWEKMGSAEGRGAGAERFVKMNSDTVAGSKSSPSGYFCRASFIKAGAVHRDRQPIPLQCHDHPRAVGTPEIFSLLLLPALQLQPTNLMCF